MNIDKTYTVESLISIGKASTNLTYKNFSYGKYIDNGNIIMPEYNIVWDYIDDMKKDAVTIELSDLEFHRYKYKPKLLCRDIYGNPELYFIILMINNIIDITEFDNKRFLMLSVANMQKYMSAIYNSEYKYLDKYSIKK